MRLKEQAVNGGQHLPLIDIHSSDCVEYAKSLNPLPSPEVRLPEEVLAKRKKPTDIIVIAIVGYSRAAKEIVDSLEKDPANKVLLYTTSLLEK